MLFHQRVKELREEKGLMQKELAKVLHLHPSLICEWENGRKRTSFEGLIALAKFFEVSTDYLLGVIDEYAIPCRAIRRLCIKSDGGYAL